MIERLVRAMKVWRLLSAIFLAFMAVLISAIMQDHSRVANAGGFLANPAYADAPSSGGDGGFGGGGDGDAGDGGDDGDGDDGDGG